MILMKTIDGKWAIGYLYDFNGKSVDEVLMTFDSYEEARAELHYLNGGN